MKATRREEGGGMTTCRVLAVAVAWRCAVLRMRHMPSVSSHSKTCTRNARGEVSTHGEGQKHMKGR